MKISVLAFFLAFVFPQALVAQTVELEHLVDLRLRGDLNTALQLVEEGLASPASRNSVKVQLHLEKARILDRFGLHRNTRPVDQALEQVKLALDLSDSSNVGVQAQIELALAQFSYREEMAERRFPNARRHARAAERLYILAEDCYGQADAVHLIGLLELQSGDNDRAAEVFDESLALDLQCGARVYFTGEYGRHRAFVFLRKEEPDQALPLLKQSLRARIEAGAVDASMFAAMTLASTHFDLDELDEALVAASYALIIAQRIDSPRGKAQSSLIIGQVFSQLGSPDKATEAFRAAKMFAESIRLNSIAAQAEEAIHQTSGGGE